MTSKHTPGPWFAVNADLTIRARSEFGLSIATVTETIVSSDGTTETVLVDAVTGEANARLIAAAPELLEVVTKLESFYGKLWDSADVKGAGLLSPESVAQYDELHAEAARAIAKATGAG